MPLCAVLPTWKDFPLSPLVKTSRSPRFAESRERERMFRLAAVNPSSLAAAAPEAKQPTVAVVWNPRCSKSGLIADPRRMKNS